jgi:hypothetical protein
MEYRHFNKSIGQLQLLHFIYLNSGQISTPMINWLKDNMDEEYTFWMLINRKNLLKHEMFLFDGVEESWAIMFLNKDDAMRFKLQWG